MFSLDVSIVAYNVIDVYTSYSELLGARVTQFSVHFMCNSVTHINFPTKPPTHFYLLLQCGERATDNQVPFVVQGDGQRLDIHGYRALQVQDPEGHCN